MSKRKREHEEEKEDMKSGEDIGLQVKIKHNSDSKQMYEEAYHEVKLVNGAIATATLKFKEINEHVDDLMSMKGRHYLSEASKMMDKALQCLRKSSQHWVSFLCIPEVPMRQILKYLSFKDKANFRLSSGGTRDIVDCFDVQFKSNRIYLDPMSFKRRRFSDLDNIVRSRKDIKLYCSDKLGGTEREFIGQVTDRLVELTGPLTAIDCIKCDAVKLETIRLDGFLSALPTTFSTFTSNLRMLKLSSIDLSDFIDTKVSLPHLEKLVLDSFQGESGLANLLASCSESLEDLSLEPFSTSSSFNLKSLHESGISLKRLKKIRLNSLNITSEILLLLKLASTNLQNLCLLGVGGPKDVQPGDLEFSLPRLESLTLQHCSFGYLSLLVTAQITPTIRNINLSDMRANSMSSFEYDLPNTIEKLKADSEDSELEFMEEVKKIIIQTAAYIKELDLMHCNIQFDSCVPEFPSLRRVHLSRCGGQLDADIVNRSLHLKVLEMFYQNDNFEKFENNTGIEKLVILGNPFREDLAGLTFSKFPNLKELQMRATNAIIKGSDKELGKLTKLSVSDSGIFGLGHILNASSSTLEELELGYNSSSYPSHRKHGEWEANIKLKEMKALKKVTVLVSSSYNDVDSDMPRLGSGGFYRLLSQCKNTLEKLTISNPCDLIHEEDYLSLKLDLPNLKVLQIHPRPSKQAMHHISQQLPCDVIYWFFPVKKLKV